jgi:hypothetical protein
LGFALGFRFKVLIVPVAIVAAAFVIALSGIASRLSPGVVVWTIVEAAVLIQIGYVAGVLASHLAVKRMERSPYSLVKKTH